ncbi:MAG: TolC family protein [Candidatus Eisenbacteria bacterium]
MILRHKRRVHLILRFCLLIVALASVSAVDLLAEQPLTIQDCISLARESNFQLAQMRTSIQKSNVGLLSAHSSFYPSVDFSTSYRNQGGFAGERQGSYSASVGLNYAIYEGGYRGAAMGAARARVEAAEEQYRLSEAQVILKVKEAFFRILQKQEQVVLVEDVVKRRKEDLILINLKYEAGRESSPAVSEAEANLLGAEYDRKRAEEELALARLDFNLLLGRPGRADVSLVHQDQWIEFPALEVMVEEATAERPELRSERANTETLQAQLTQARSNYLPRVSASSSYQLQTSDFQEQSSNWNVGMSLSLPLFDGFARKAKVQEATLSVENQSDRIRELEQQIEADVEQAYSTWELARRIIEVTEATLAAAREMYRLTKLQYEQGSTSYFFLQQKESGLTQAENSHLAALFNLRVSTARLQKAWGG